MPGTYVKPKGFNRRFFINSGTKEAPQWEEIAQGIRSRGNSINETSVDYFDMATRGVVIKEAESIQVQRSFTGVRLIGDKAQDFVIDRLYQISRREVEYLMFYDNMEEGAINGEQGTANFTITDDGSGDANARENIAFALNISDTPKRGKVTMDEETKQPQFTAVPV